MAKVCSVINAYEAGFLETFLGETLRPGGIELTRKLMELAGVKPGYRVLEIGSGKGETAIFLAENYGCEVTGLDASLVMIEAARQKANMKKLQAGKVQFWRGTAENLGFDNEYFDLIVAECFLSLFTAKDKVVSEVFRVLKKGGRFVFSDFVLTRKHAESEKEKLPLLSNLCLGGAGRVDQYSSILQEIGFSKVQVKIEYKVMREMALQLFTSFGCQEGFWDSAQRHLGEPGATTGESYVQYMKATRPQYAIFLAHKES